MKSPLPKSITDVIPEARSLAAHLDALSAEIDALFSQADARKTDPITVARVFVVLHRLNEKIEGLTRSSSTLGKWGKLYEAYKKEVVPQVLEAAGVPHVALAEGFRVGVSSQTFISVKDRDKAFHWLRTHKLGDLITNTVNSSTLSAALRNMMDEDNLDPPDDIFSVATIATASVTAT